MKNMHWTEPTKFLERLGDALEVLCQGNRPSDVMMRRWLDKELDDFTLQYFCSDHAVDWMQGIQVIDAALKLADNPVEGVEHEYRDAN